MSCAERIPNDEGCLRARREFEFIEIAQARFEQPWNLQLSCSEFTDLRTWFEFAAGLDGANEHVS